MTQLRSVTSHKGSHSVTCYPTRVNALRLHPSQTGWYSIYRSFKDGGLSKCTAVGLQLQRTFIGGTVHYGVFSLRPVIVRGTKFGPFRGRVVNPSEIKTSADNSFMWEVSAYSIDVKKEAQLLL